MRVSILFLMLMIVCGVNSQYYYGPYPYYYGPLYYPYPYQFQYYYPPPYPYFYFSAPSPPSSPSQAQPNITFGAGIFPTGFLNADLGRRGLGALMGAGVAGLLGLAAVGK